MQPFQGAVLDSNRCGLCQFAYRDTFLQQLGDFFAVSRHLVNCAAVNQCDIAITESPGHARAVHRGVAGSDDADALPKVDRVALFRFAQEAEGIDNAVAV